MLQNYPFIHSDRIWHGRDALHKWDLQLSLRVEVEEQPCERHGGENNKLEIRLMKYLEEWCGGKKVWAKIGCDWLR